MDQPPLTTVVAFCTRHKPPTPKEVQAWSAKIQSHQHISVQQTTLARATPAASLIAAPHLPAMSRWSSWMPDAPAHPPRQPHKLADLPLTFGGSGSVGGAGATADVGQVEDQGVTQEASGAPQQHGLSDDAVPVTRLPSRANPAASQRSLAAGQAAVLLPQVPCSSQHVQDQAISVARSDSGLMQSLLISATQTALPPPPPAADTWQRARAARRDGPAGRQLKLLQGRPLGTYRAMQQLLAAWLDPPAEHRNGNGRRSKASLTAGQSDTGSEALIPPKRKRKKRAAAGREAADGDLAERHAPKKSKRAKSGPAGKDSNAKRASGTAKKAPAVDLLPARLEASEQVSLAGSPAELQRCREAVAGCAACCLGLLMRDSTSGSQHYSSLRALSKQTGVFLAAGPACAVKAVDSSATDGTETAPSPETATTDERSPVLGAAIMVLPCKQPAAALLPNQHTYFIPLQTSASPPKIADQAQALVEDLLRSGSIIFCFNMTGVLHQLLLLGLRLPPAGTLRLVDPAILCWLHEPQLAQKDEKEIECYNLQELVARHSPAEPASAQASLLALQPLQQLAADLAQAADLAVAMHSKLVSTMPAATVKGEMHVAAMLAHMQAVGMGFDPGCLRSHEGWLRRRCAAIEAQAEQVVGRRINLSSSLQLAQVLYNDLRLPPPLETRRGKTHHSTDEASLKQLVPLHALPALILEYRQLQNAVTKAVDLQWTRSALGGGGEAGAPGMWDISVRDAFVAPPGCVLLAADYSQIELRVLAHLSGDSTLIRLLQQAGARGDVFSLIASTWLRQSQGLSQGGPVSEVERAHAKQVTYGMIYGMTAFGISRGAGGLRIQLAAAQQLIDSFLQTFKGVGSWLQATGERARQQGLVYTLGGRHRPIPGIASNNGRLRSEAERKAVNSSIQGSAADLIKIAMCRWSDREAQQQQQAGVVGSRAGPPITLVAQIHDELLFEVDVRRCTIATAAAIVRQHMEGVANLRVPLSVKIQAGPRFGSLQAL
ncbi:hypothetical protein WJX72_003400 [[Myrmecia] bisecta]|uniref:DNA-directed DNA polymerase family A palm domain-containing protein n=1 Tax=[Myrmecia] bisecta TaxID=41462 RepID=A0AAW1P8K2_9CHLO